MLVHLKVYHRLGRYGSCGGQQVWHFGNLLQARPQVDCTLKAGGVILIMTDSRTENALIQAVLTASSTAKHILWAVLTLGPRPAYSSTYKNREATCGAFPAKAKSFIKLGHSDPAGMLVEIILSQALTCILAGLVVAAILH